MNNKILDSSNNSSCNKESWKELRILELFMQPSIIIAIITAIAGPITVSIFSNSVKDREIQSKEIAERSKLQAAILSQVINLTSSANFDKEAEIVRAGVVSTIVNENKKLFDLDLTESKRKFDELASSINTQATKILSDKIKIHENEIETLKHKTEEDHYQILKKEDKIKIINAKLSNLQQNSIENANEIEILNKEKNEYNNEIAKLKILNSQEKERMIALGITMQESEKKLDSYRKSIELSGETISELSEKNANLAKLLNLANDKISTLEDENKKYKNIIEHQQQVADENKHSSLNNSKQVSTSSPEPIDITRKVTSEEQVQPDSTQIKTDDQSQ